MLVPTMHGLAKEDVQIDETLAKYMRKAQTLVLESPLVPRSQQDIDSYLRYGLYGQGDSLASHMDATVEPAMRECAKESGVPYEKFVMAKPWFSTLHISYLRRPGDTGAPGIDWRLLKLAQAQRKPVLYLESPAESAQVMNSIPEPLQVAMLEYACEGLHTKHPSLYLQSLQEAWRGGDADALQKLADSPVSGQPPELFQMSMYVYEAGTARFAQSLQRADILSAKGPILVAIGFGHFFGTASLLGRLKRMGYAVSGPKQ
jgi:uncharacterized protein YbaP (TraB family)